MFFPGATVKFKGTKHSLDCSLEDASLRQDSRLPDSRLVKEKGVAVGHRHHGAAQLRSIVVKPASYRDVVVGKSYRRSWSNKAESSGRNYFASSHRGSRPCIDEDGFEEVREKYWWRRGRRPVQ